MPPEDAPESGSPDICSVLPPHVPRGTSAHDSSSVDAMTKAAARESVTGSKPAASSCAVSARRTAPRTSRPPPLPPPVPSPYRTRAGLHRPRQAVSGRQFAQAAARPDPMHLLRTSWATIRWRSARCWSSPCSRPRRSPSSTPSANHACVARLKFSPILERKYVPSTSTSSKSTPSRRRDVGHRRRTTRRDRAAGRLGMATFTGCRGLQKLHPTPLDPVSPPPRSRPSRGRSTAEAASVPGSHRRSSPRS